MKADFRSVRTSLRLGSIDFRPDTADYRHQGVISGLTGLAKTDFKPVKPDLRSKMDDMKAERAHVLPEKADFRLPRSDFRPH